MTTITHEIRVAALAHSMAAFTALALATCEEGRASDKADTALDLWLEQHGYASREENLNLALEAVQASGAILLKAIHETSSVGRADVGAAGRLILRWAEDEGLSSMQFIQRPLH